MDRERIRQMGDDDLGAALLKVSHSAPPGWNADVLTEVWIRWHSLCEQAEQAKAERTHAVQDFVDWQVAQFENRGNNDD